MTTGDLLNLSGDGGVQKRILKEGTGEVVPPRAKVRVHYTGKLEDGTEFDSSRTRNEPFNFTLGKGSVIKGWEIGVGSMKLNEQALLICRADYAYGDEGSPPSIPGGATLHFDVELLGWDDPEPDTTPERLKAAEKLKLQGNELFKEKRYSEALEKYNKGLDLFAHLWGLEDDEKKQVDVIKLSLLLNASACQVEIKDYDEAFLSCSKALDIDTHSVKALFRRGKALSAKNEFEKAKADLVEAAKYAPNNKEIRQELDALKIKMNEYNKKQKEMFAGMFK